MPRWIIEPSETMDGHILVDFQFFGPPPGDLEELYREAVDALEQ